MNNTERIKACLADNTEELGDIMRACGLDEREIAYRYCNLKKAENFAGSTLSPISHRYYELAHEIRCMQFLGELGTTEISKDSHSTSGCDCFFQGKYNIEFVCSSGGETTKTGLPEYCKKDGSLIDYGVKEQLLLARLSNSITNKKEFYQKHAGDKRLLEHPYIVFIGLGELAIEAMFGDYGIDICGVLLGKGNPSITVDKATGQIISTQYEYRPEIEKRPGVRINANIWCDPDYSVISGIIVSEATIYEPYTKDNTWLFLNPFAKQAIESKDFINVVCWIEENGEYYPVENGKRIE